MNEMIGTFVVVVYGGVTPLCHARWLLTKVPKTGGLLSECEEARGVGRTGAGIILTVVIKTTAAKSRQIRC